MHSRPPNIVNHRIAYAEDEKKRVLYIKQNVAQFRYFFPRRVIDKQNVCVYLRTPGTGQYVGCVKKQEAKFEKKEKSLYSTKLLKYRFGQPPPPS